MITKSIFTAILVTFSLQSQLHAGLWVDGRSEDETSWGEAVDQPKFRQLVKATSVAESYLKNDSVLSGIDNVRLQPNRDIGYPEVDGGLTAAYLWVGLHRPDVWEGRDGIDQELADYNLNARVQIEYNAPVSFLTALGQSYEAGRPVVFPLSPEQREAYEKFGIYLTDGVAARAVRADGGPIMTPYSVKEHLDRWEIDLERMKQLGAGEFAQSELSSLREFRRNLDNASLSEQVALSSEATSEHIWGFEKVGSGNSIPLYCISSDLFAEKKGNQERVDLIVISYSLYDATDPIAPYLFDWLKQVDVSDLERLIL